MAGRWLTLGGLLHVHKPSGMTSNALVSGLKGLVGPDVKVGHTGTLDPLASGVMLLCIGESTTLSSYLTQKDKRYQALLELGTSTDSYDCLGRITRQATVFCTEEELRQALTPFKGKIKQKVPPFSAVRRDGERLYDKARRGEEIPDLPSREVTIHSLILRHCDLHAKEAPPRAVLDIHCSSGTYIRSLVHDLGEQLGCGGHLKGLIRQAVGQFELENAVPWDTIASVSDIQRNLISPEILLEQAPSVKLRPLQVETLLRVGTVYGALEDFPVADFCRAYSSTSGKFMGVVSVKRAQGQSVVNNVCGFSLVPSGLEQPPRRFRPSGTRTRAQT